MKIIIRLAAAATLLVSAQISAMTDAELKTITEQRLLGDRTGACVAVAVIEKTVAPAAPATTHIVFTTAYDEYAVNAFETGAVDYLLKPIKRDRLQQAIERSRLRADTPTSADMHTFIEKMQQQLQTTNRKTLKWISASVGDTIKMFAIEDVQFFQAQDKYVRVVTNADEVIIRTPLKDLMADLDPETFWQVHRSLLVRASAIERVKRDDLGKYHLHLKGKSEILPVSGAFQHRFKSM